jgi:methionine-rich copper-binding protein CopC
MTRLRPVALTAAVLLLLALPSAVAAHSEFVSGTPKNGATVQSGPIDIVGNFSEMLDPKSHMELRDASGGVVARAAVDGDQMRIGLEGLQPGVYEVRWTSVAEDGDVLRNQPGDWTFTVAAASPSPPSAAPSSSAAASAPASARPSVVVTAAPSASAPPGTTTGSSSGDVLLPIVAALVVVALLGGLLLRRRTPTAR